MPDILVRGLDRATVERLKRRARGRGRSLQSEVKAIIEQASAVDMESALAMADAIRTFPVTLHPFSVLLDPAWEIAARTGRSLYDCLYVSLAVVIGCRVVTADRKLHQGLATGPLGEHVLWVGDA